MDKTVDNEELLSKLKDTALLLATEQNPDYDDERDWRLQLNDALNYVRERGSFIGDDSETNSSTNFCTASSTSF